MLDTASSTANARYRGLAIIIAQLHKLFPLSILLNVRVPHTLNGLSPSKTRKIVENRGKKAKMSIKPPTQKLRVTKMNPAKPIDTARWSG